ncbi:MAG: hypothetical protein RBT67_02845 [Thauera sp.]|nr:hypothetical protein [Thauera sp.]
MPLDPNHIHADTPHEKTIQPAGYRYGCKDTQRGGTHTYWLQDGWTADGRRRMVSHTTEWLPVKCGTTYAPVMGPCADCKNRGEA